MLPAEAALYPIHHFHDQLHVQQPESTATLHLSALGFRGSGLRRNSASGAQSLYFFAEARTLNGTAAMLAAKPFAHIFLAD